MTTLKNVTVLGTGVLGSQIAYQTAYSGFIVSVYDISEVVIESARARFAGLATTYQREVTGATVGKTDAALSRISYFTDLGAAVANADIVIEAVPEVLTIKQDTYTKLGALAPAKTIFATNSSTMLPSAMKGFTGRPKQFLALHFANQVWKFNTAEVMGTTDTDPAVFETVVEFAAEIGMVPIPIHKEKAGYVLNTLLVPLLNAAAGLAAGGIADPHDIDKVWRIATGAPLGPFQIYDVIGLTTPYNILSQGGEADQKLAAWLKENYIDKGKLGVASGEGFYAYPKGH
jgi:3-hydroxyacyl-CoA dehydrogenase